MYVIKRDGTTQGVDFNKVTNRIRHLSKDLQVDPIIIAQKVCSSISDGITTEQLDNLSADISISLATTHPDYGILAAHILMSNLHKQTHGFEHTFEELYKDGRIADDVYESFCKNKERILNSLNYDRDYSLDFFSIKTLLKSYLFKIDKTIERPQDMWMRVALGIHKEDIAKVLETYEYMSLKWFIHATPTLFNAGTKRPQLSSCFLIAMENDSINGIYNTLSKCANISKWAGGIGLHIHNIRSTGSLIKGTNGNSTGIIPMLKVFNSTARYVNQGGKRNGSIAIYLQVDHPDVFKFLDLRKNTGDEEERCRDLFLAAWIPDLFMKRVKENKMWSLFCPSKVPGLSDIYGEEYERLYSKYEDLGLYTTQVSAQKLWFAICESQIETGTPYILYKDAINSKSNQKNVGVIKSSNLCTEIVQYTDKDEIAVCNLASISLPRFVKDGSFDFEKLKCITGIITENLNRIIDVNFYPVEEAMVSNKRHRPIGIGVQGLADVYMLLKYNFESEEARLLNTQIFETIYYTATKKSMELAQRDGPYETFHGSPISEGVFQFDLWNAKPIMDYDWEELRKNVIEHGVRNSLLLAPMPTASTSQILGNNECFEPYTSNLYLRRTLAGEFVVLNKHLVNDLLRLELWNKDIKDEIIKNDGSVQNIESIPKGVRDLYKTAWEIKQKEIINQAVDRAKYVCQSQSMNLFVSQPTFKLLNSMQFYAWEKGLKTGIYYLRTQPAANPIKFTVCSSCSA